MVHAGHASQYGSVNVMGSVGGSHHHDVTSGICGEAVPEAHELSFDHYCGFMICTGARPQEGIWRIRNMITRDRMNADKHIFCCLQSQ